MSGPELRLDELPRPPLFKLAGEDGEGRFRGDALVGGEPSKVGALFLEPGSRRGVHSGAGAFGLEALAGLVPVELADWSAVEVYSASGQDYVLVVSRAGTGPSRRRPGTSRSGGGGVPLPLYVISDERERVAPDLGRARGGARRPALQLA